MRRAEVAEGKGPAGALSTAEREELVRLRRENRQLRLHAELPARGRRVSRKRVARLMGQQHLAARNRRRFVRTTDSRHGLPVAPNVLERDFSPDTPNSTWATDSTSRL